MPRQARLDAPGTPHHVILRGIERGQIVADREDRESFLARLGLSLADTARPLGVSRRGLRKRSRERSDHQSTESTTSRIKQSRITARRSASSRHLHLSARQYSATLTPSGRPHPTGKVGGTTPSYIFLLDLTRPASVR